MSLSRRDFLERGAGALAGFSLWDMPLFEAFGPTPPNDAGPFEAPPGLERDGVSHVLERVTYGPRPGDYARVKRMGIANFLEEQLHPEHIDDWACDKRVRRLTCLRAPVAELYEYKQAFLERALTRHTILRAVYSKRQLFEVMAGFWTDHFNIDISKGECPWLKAADDRDVIRKHAMGRFPDLLRASALSPAMLWYLDGRANTRRKPDDQPNENYARELLELHTLGVHGGYTQRDVMEVARCLTGWTVRDRSGFRKARVEFIAAAHDAGEKTVLGERIPPGLGAEDLDRVLDIVCRHPSTARHIAEKLCQRFISDAPPEAAIAAVAARFSATNGDVRKVLRTLFSTPAFLATNTQKLKRPFRFLVSALRACDSETDGEQPLIAYLERMGHAPFQYPTPDGYPDESAPWMGTLLWRWHFVAALTENRIAGTQTDVEALTGRFGSTEQAAAHLLGRRPTEQEWAAITASGLGAPAAMAAPAFHWC